VTLNALEQSVISNVSREIPWQTVVDLSETIRLSGNDDEARAIAYLREKLTSYGVAHTLHTPELFVSWPLQSTLRVVGPDGFTLMAKSPAMSISTDGKEVEGDILYVETGWAKGVMSLFSAVDLGDIDLTGKVVVTEGLPMPGKVADIAARGAVAAIFVGPGERIHEGVCTSIWGSPDLETMHRQPAIPIIAINKPQGEQLIARAKAGPVRVAFSTKLDTRWRSIPILVAEIRGQTAPDEFVLLHGHLDGWHQGVGDNLTGDATMLEVARVLQQHAGQLERSVRIAWWSGHSHGRYAGSTWYADEFGLDLAENCVAQVDCDSPGCRWTSVFTNVMWTEEAGPLVRGAISDVTGQDAHWARPLRAGDYSFQNLGLTGYLMLSSTMPDDLRAEKNYYAVGGCGGNIAWHTEDDTLEIGDPDNLYRDVKLYAVALLRALNATVPAFDFRVTLDEFGRIIAGYQQTAGDRFDLGVAAADIAAARAALDGFYARVAALDGRSAGDAAARAASRTQRQLARILVPVNYARNARFRQDPAETVQPLPELSVVSRLAAAAPGSHEARAAQISLQRGMNRLRYALRQATLVASGQSAIDA
jgi:N-acetylated-alpha-linked acidic dipeptidase